MAGAGASIGDLVVTNDKKEEINKKLGELSSCEQKLDDLQNKLKDESECLLKLYKLSEEDARMAALKGLTSISPGVISAGGQILSVSGRLAMTTAVTGGKLATDLGRISISSVSTAASFSEVAVEGGQVIFFINYGLLTQQSTF